MAKGKVKPSGAVDLTGRPAITSDQLNALEGQMLEVSNAILKKEVPADAELALGAIVSQLDPPIAQARERLDALRESMKTEYSTFSWYERNIDNPATYDDKQSVEKQLDGWLKQASAIRGGARVALRVRQEQKTGKSPETWQSDQDAAHQAAKQAQGSAGWSGAVAVLARFQGELQKESVAARVEANGRADDLDTYDDLTWFWQRSKVLDVLTLGESEKGRVFRAGKGQAVSAGDLADRFEAVFGKGENRLHDSINQLLRHEDPSGYGVTRKNYDVVKPAFDALRSVQGQALTVLSELSDVESALSHAAMIRAQEPSRTVTRTNQEGKLETVDNPDHDSWKSRVQWAESAVISAKSDVSNALARLNDLLPGLVQALGAAELEAYLGQVNTDLASWNNWLSIFGGSIGGFAGWASWAYDQSQVSGVRSDIGALQLELSPLDAVLTPRFESLHAEVWKRIGERRAKLVSKGE